MDFRKVLFNKKIIIGILVLIPILMILLVILCRDVITPSNEDIISELKDTKYYSSKLIICLRILSLNSRKIQCNTIVLIRGQE